MNHERHLTGDMIISCQMDAVLTQFLGPAHGPAGVGRRRQCPRQKGHPVTVGSSPQRHLIMSESILMTHDQCKSSSSDATELDGGHEMPNHATRQHILDEGSYGKAQINSWRGRVFAALQSI